MAAIKVILGIIKNYLKQKVDREEFAALAEPVGRLEAKVRQCTKAKGSQVRRDFGR